MVYGLMIVCNSVTGSAENPPGNGGMREVVGPATRKGRGTVGGREAGRRPVSRDCG